MNKIVFIGAGNMSGAIIEGMLSAGVPSTTLWATNRSEDKRAQWAAQGLNTSADNLSAVAGASVVVLGVKPVHMNDLLASLAASIPENALVITVAAGVPLRNYEHFLPNNPICRVMPNTPCLVKTGVSGVFYSDNCSERDRSTVTKLFRPLGLVHTCQTEAEIDLVIAAAGSAPAYFFLFMEAMIDAAISQGLRPEDAAAMVKQTALGAARMAIGSEDEPAVLRRKVTSPGGTTAQAIARFTSENLHGIVASAMVDCSERAHEMAELFQLKHGE
ncbi:MAG: pyrroline-5-carboxylate reductase [Pseudomonadales bacterium]|jgi:pyrroline-5-carboxylate reductase